MILNPASHMVLAMIKLQASYATVLEDSQKTIVKQTLMGVKEILARMEQLALIGLANRTANVSGLIHTRTKYNG